MSLAIITLKSAKRIIGGGVVFVECEDNEKLLSFYQNDVNRYKLYGERTSEKDGKTYKQLLHFF